MKHGRKLGQGQGKGWKKEFEANGILISIKSKIFLSSRKIALDAMSTGAGLRC